MEWLICVPQRREISLQVCHGKYLIINSSLDCWVCFVFMGLEDLDDLLWINESCQSDFDVVSRA